MLTIKLVYPIDETGRVYYQVWKQVTMPAGNTLWCMVEYGWLVGNTLTWLERTVLDPNWEPEWDHPGHFPDAYKVDRGIHRVVRNVDEFLKATYATDELRIPNGIRDVVVSYEE